MNNLTGTMNNLILFASAQIIKPIMEPELELCSCCLCLRVIRASELKRRRKLYGVSARAKQGREVLLELMGGLSLQDFVQTRDESAYLCFGCEKLLADITTFKNRFDEAKSRVSTEIAGLKKVSALKRPPTSQPIQPRKQTCTAAAVAQPCAQPSHSGIANSPDVKVAISYKKSTLNYDIHTPTRKRAIKRIVRKKYNALASGLLDSHPRQLILKLTQKVKKEMKEFSSEQSYSIQTDQYVALKQFSWLTVLLEMKKALPTLVEFLSRLIPRSETRTPLLCMIIGQVLKSRHQRMSLLQRVISTILYGNGAKKQLYNVFKQLNICMSYTATLSTVDKLCEDHDITVQFWMDDIKESLVPPVTSSNLIQLDPDSDIEAPPYSPLSSDTELEDTELEDPMTDDLLDTAGLEDTDSSLDISSRSLDISSHAVDSDIDEFSDLEDNTASLEDSFEDTSVSLEDSSLSPTGSESGVGYQGEKSASPHHLPESQQLGWSGFKLVGDNVDKNVYASFQRSDDYTVRSLHHFHVYAVKDRINLSALADTPPKPCKVDAEFLLPSQSDIVTIKKEMSILLSRILIQHMPQYKDQKKDVIMHIESEYTTEMASKSEVIPLGVQLLNENCLDQMSKIMENLHAYVPSFEAEGSKVLSTGATATYDDTKFHKILFGGDQLTVVRARSCQILRSTHDTAIDRLGGLVPVIEDWHAKMTLVKVIWKRLYSRLSGKDKGTMFQIRNLINRSNVPLEPDKNMKAAEDFLLLLLHSHAVCAAQTIDKFVDVDSVMDMGSYIVNNYVFFPELLPQKAKGKADEDVLDKVNVYATEFLTLALLWHAFNDSIREGDGDRIIRYWKLLLVLFKSSGNYNYAKDAVNLLLLHKYKLSDRKAAQLMWSRTINTKGRRGHNIPMDLHMEHLNRQLKGMLSSVGANIRPNTIVKAGKAVHAVHTVSESFSKDTGVQPESDKHPYPSFSKDFTQVVTVLNENSVFIPTGKREHSSFTFKSGLLQRWPRNKLVQLTKTSIQQLS